MSQMTTIVRRYTAMIRNGRTPTSIIKHMRGEVEELQAEIDGTGDGRDGVVGENIDIIACALDMIFEVQPDITDAEIDAIMEAKCAKWARKVNEGAYEPTMAPEHEAFFKRVMQLPPQEGYPLMRTYVQRNKKSDNFIPAMIAGLVGLGFAEWTNGLLGSDLSVVNEPVDDAALDEFLRVNNLEG